MAGCPMMTDIAHCPLYIESHNGRSLGCVKDMSQPCLVAQGKMQFQEALLRLARHDTSDPVLLRSIQTVGVMQ